MPDATRPDVFLLSAEWPNRALLRAELLEQGYEVAAADTWPMPRLYRQRGMKPRVIVVDLHGLPNPREVLDELRYVIPPDRVLIVSALGTVTHDAVSQLGYHVMTRPVSVGEIVAATSQLLRAHSSAD
jgi:DNA-binding response OmpR family regulator